MKKNLYLLLLLILIQLPGFSQLTVTTNAVATSLAQNITGSGVTVTNATINCDKKGAGTFTYTGATLGVSSGILLTTGYASEVANKASYFCDEQTGNFFNDPDLTIVEASDTNDVCILQFDFVPICSSLSITFVFGSEEYPEYECNVNDAFGIFLTGPKPAGGSYTGTNIAVLPNGTQVTINNINDGSSQGDCSSPNNPTYYQANYSGLDIAYGGLTKPITSVNPVVPCSTYHMKIAIADAQDELYDSGVFIKGNSVSCTNTPTVAASATPANCGNTGSATATITNYTGTTTYQWQPGGATTATISNLAAGIYTCTVGMQLGCSGVTDQTVTATVPAIGSTFSYTTTAQSPLCTGGSNGSANVIVGGGVAPYSYTWTTTPAQTTTNATNLAAGVYTISIKDNTGCIGTTSVTVTNPPAIVATVTTAPTTCTASIGSATATINSGGTAPYTYTWSTTPVQTGQTASNLSQGTYTVAISDKNGCSANASGIVGTQSFAWSPSVSETNPLCAGGANGSATVSINNPGSSTFTYSWSTTPAQTSTVITNLSAGNYTVYVTDNNGCISKASTVLSNPAPIPATINTSPTICKGSVGSATAVVTNGGTAPYTYTWSPSGGNAVTAVNLAQGSYSVSITDANGCLASATGSVSSTGFTWSPSVTVTNPSCIGATNGSATISVTNPGSSTFTYSWSTTPAQTNTVATTLSVSSYTVYVTDNNGCLSKAIATLNNPPPIPATINTSPTICTGSVGSATATVISGGLAPYTYTWSPSGGNAATAVDLAQGSYSVAITDANGCSASATGSVSSTGFTWSPSVASTNPICIGKTDGTATVSITNPGSSTFTYSWVPTAQTNSVATNLSAGSYTVSVTDNNGCLSKTSATLTNPPPITATVNTSPTICTGSVGSATASVISGGTAPYTYQWITNPVQSGQSIANLPSGAYSVLVIDTNGCQSLALFTGTVSSTPATWTAVASQTPATCFGKSNGTATVSIPNIPAGGTYTCTSWDTNPSTGTIATNTVVTGLSAGTYVATVIDNNGCIGKAFVTVTQPNQVQVTTETSPAICTATNGTAIATVFGGTSPYTYLWSSVPPQPNSTATNLAKGTYTVWVADTHTCTATAIAIVKDTTDLTVTASSSPDLCNKGVGSAIANPKGESPYQYTWNTNPVQITQVADSLTIGTYSVTVLDHFGCISSASTTVVNHNDILSSDLITAPSGPIYAENVTTLHVITNGGWAIDTGTAYLSNGIAITGNPFNYTFSQYGNYTATYYFTSIHGCKESMIYNIVVTDYMTLYIPNAFTPNGDGKNDVFAAEGTFINTFEMYIYDRWGILVTKLDDITKVWDGTKNGGRASEDTYVYKGNASDIFGKHITFQGQINLIR